MSSRFQSSPPPESVPLRDLSPPESILSDDFDRLLSDDEAGSDGSSIHVGFSQPPPLPQIDRGRHAWTFLAACWLLEAMVWGFPLAFGIFQSHYSTHPLFKDDKRIPTIGTLATGVSYLGMPFTNAIVIRWPLYQRHMCLLGYILCILGLVGASFATQVWHLLLFQGLLFGVGWVVCYTPFLFMLNGWFEKRRGLAYGILFGASGASGLVIPLVVGYMLQHLDFRITLRIYALAAVLVSGPGFFLIKPRIPPSAQPRPQTPQEAKDKDSLGRVLRSPHFAIFATVIFLQGLAFFLPNIFLPSYASALQLSQPRANGLLAILSLSQVAGQMTLGYASDKLNPYLPLSVAAFIPGAGAFFLWGPAKTWGPLAWFSGLWGFWSASYSVLYTSTCMFLTKDKEVGMLVYGIFSFERGVANILEGPVGAWLIGETEVDMEVFGLQRWTRVVWFTGVCMFLASLAVVGVFLRRPR